MNKLMSHRAVAGLGLAVAMAVSAPAFAASTPAEAANKQVVIDFYAALNRADAAGTTKTEIKAIAEKYLSPEYKQNTIVIPGPGTDRDKLITMFQSMPAMPTGGGAPPVQRTDAIMAEGDKVMMLTSRPQPGPEGKRSYIFNMFRVKDGKLVEHWDGSAGGGGGAPPGGPGGPPGGPGGPPPGAN